MLHLKGVTNSEQKWKKTIDNSYFTCIMYFVQSASIVDK